MFCKTDSIFVSISSFLNLITYILFWFKNNVLLMSHSSVDICGILLSLDDLNNSYQFVQTPNPLT